MKLKFLVLVLCFSTNLLASDPFLWLEESSSERTKQWICDQQKKTAEFFAALPSLSDKRVLQEITAYSSCGLPQIRDNGLFYLKQNKGDETCALVFAASKNHEKVLFCPASDNAISITQFEASPSGKLVTFGTTQCGSDEETWHVINLEYPKFTSDQVEGLKFSKPVWSKDEKSFFYVKSASQVYCHKLRTPQREDQLIFQKQEDGILQLLDITQDGQYLVLSLRVPKSKKNGIFLLNVAIPSGAVQNITCISPGHASFHYVGENNKHLFFVTDFDAPYGKLVSIPLEDPTFFATIIPDQQIVFSSAIIAQDTIVCIFYKAAVAQLQLFDLSGKFIREIDLPGYGTVALQKDSTCCQRFYYSYTDFSLPQLIYEYDLQKGIQEVFFQPSLSWEPKNFQTKQVWYTSRDGTPIPLFLTSRRDCQISEKTPVLLYGYGGFGISETPKFNPFELIWIEQGGVYAVANIRGGYEFGREWYEAGSLKNKQNVFNDFIDAAEWLISKKIGSSKTLAIYGTSNGGLLTGACVTQRPDLFGAVIVNKGVLDMTRFHLFTVGRMWKCDYGDPEQPEDYTYLLSYSPYHNVKPAAYPPTLINTSDHDDRVSPIHSYKFAAALQKENKGDYPILLRIEQNNGHKQAATCSQVVDNAGAMLTFLKNFLKAEFIVD